MPTKLTDKEREIEIAEMRRDGMQEDDIERELLLMEWRGDEPESVTLAYLDEIGSTVHKGSITSPDQALRLAEAVIDRWEREEGSQMHCNETEMARVILGTADASMMWKEVTESNWWEDEIDVDMLAMAYGGKNPEYNVDPTDQLSRYAIAQMARYISSEGVKRLIGKKGLATNQAGKMVNAILYRRYPHIPTIIAVKCSVRALAFIAMPSSDAQIKDAIETAMREIDTEWAKELRRGVGNEKGYGI